MSNLKVIVRVRPMSNREIELNSLSSVSVENAEVSVTNIKVPEHHAGDSRKRVRKFSFDYCFGENTTQEEIFSTIESEVSNALSNRYHACVLAYGQSSTGKTYTMMGLQDEPGLTPRLCENIFKYFQSSVTEEEIKETHTSVSYLEIYNERVQDLLSSINNGKSLKVREHPKKGPYVQGLTEHKVSTATDLLTYLSSGNGNRRVAATSNNRRSSRSHSVFTITSSSSSCCCRLHLVDLAGSERANAFVGNAKSGFFGGNLNKPRLNKEGANINRSLVALGNVICALADQSGKQGRNIRKRFVPYRDSVLTWLLKETLSGNSKTVMIATISPSSSCYSETINTLRFGQRAKQIVNRPMVNEDPKEKLIKELRAEILRLKGLLITQEQNSNSHENLKIPVVNNLNPEMETSITDNKIEDETEKSNKTSVLEIKNVPEILETISKVSSKDNQNDSELATEINTENNFIKTDKLIPVIDITSSVKSRPAKNSQLNRTLSVDFSKSVIGKLKREFGSHETLPITTLTKNKSLIKESTESLNQTTKPDKTTETSSRSGSISESSGKSTPKKNSTQTRRVHRRSEVVAAVTQRLYSQQVKKKEETMSSSPFPRSNLCNNARMKLQELTQRALRASKRKIHVEVQTEDKKSTLRCKEKYTDVQDMQIALLKVKDANIEAVTSTQNVGISCYVENYGQTIKLTNSCSTQTEEVPKNENNISFTEYLRNSPSVYTQPIFTSSVNINVSHHYLSNKDDSISSDSLDELPQQTIHLSTPDLISNHNSLDASTTSKKIPGSPDKKTGTSQNIKYNLAEFFASNSTEYCVAETSIVPPVKEIINEVYIPKICKPETRKFNERSQNSKQEIDKREKMMKVLENFMDEASSLLLKLNSIALHVEKSEELRQNRNATSQQFYYTDSSTKDCYVQTYFPYHDASMQTINFDQDEEDFEENKYEKVLKTSVDKLEQCLKLADHKTKYQNTLFESLHKFPQPFSSDHDWKYCPTDYSSLETSHSASDYGSLPRRELVSRRSPYRSPKAYMKQLVAMRKQIVETSRQDLLEELNSNDI